ncbi:MAG: TVP38/TMEM64 family protein [Promethearchaeota archaeon]
MDLKKTLKDKKTWYILAFFALLILTALLLLLWITDKEIFSRLMIEFLIIPTLRIGIWGLALFLIIMIIQGILLPIPSEILLLTTGLLWGIVGGTIIGVIGSMFAAWTCYFIVLKGGRPVAEKIVGKKLLDPIDNLIQKYGTWFIVFSRAIPLIAFDPISFASGLLKIDFKKYTLATLGGSIFRALFYSWLGFILLPPNATNWPVGAPDIPNTWLWFITTGEFETFTDRFNILILLVVGILAGMFVLYNFVINPMILKKGSKASEDVVVESQDAANMVNRTKTPGENEMKKETQGTDEDNSNT